MKILAKLILSVLALVVIISGCDQIPKQVIFPQSSSTIQVEIRMSTLTQGVDKTTVPTTTQVATMTSSVSGSVPTLTRAAITVPTQSDTTVQTSVPTDTKIPASSTPTASQIPPTSTPQPAISFTKGEDVFCNYENREVLMVAVTIRNDSNNNVVWDGEISVNGEKVGGRPPENNGVIGPTQWARPAGEYTMDGKTSFTVSGWVKLYNLNGGLLEGHEINKTVNCP